MKTQIKKTILGNFSNFFGKFFGLFFVLISNSLFSQIYISENSVLYIDEEEIISSSSDDVSNDQEEQVKIYIVNKKSEIEKDHSDFEASRKIETGLIKKNSVKNTEDIVDAKIDYAKQEEQSVNAPEFLNTSNQSFRDSASGNKNYAASSINLKVQTAIIRILKGLHFSFETITDRKIVSSQRNNYQQHFLFGLSVRPPPFLLNI